MSKEIEKIIKKVQLDSDKRMKNYLGVLNEQTEDRFKATKEGFESINERLDKMQGNIDDIRIELRETKLKVQDVSYGVNITLDKKVDKKLFLDLDSRVKVLEKK